MKIWIFLLFLFFPFIVSAKEYPINQYIEYLAIDDQRQSLRLDELTTKFHGNDIPTLKRLVSLMEERVKQKNSKFLQVRFNYFKLVVLRGIINETNHKAFISEFRKSVAIANDMKNEMLLADGCYWFALILNEHRYLAEALFYNLKSIELIEKSGSEKYYWINQRYHLLGELLYHTREYEKSIAYSRKALHFGPRKPQPEHPFYTLNNIGLAYQKLGQLDSAIVYFDRAAKSAADFHNKIWVTIPNANKAQIWFSQQKNNEALPLFEADYQESKKVGDLPNAANNLQWMAKVYLAQNKPELALQTATMALKIIRLYQAEGIKANIYQTMSTIYQGINKPDSANHYRVVYFEIHDRLEAEVATSRSEIIQLRLDDERNHNKIDLLQKDLQIQKLKINAFLVLVVLLALVIYLFYNRQRLKLEQQRQLKDSELRSAQEQMQLFTKTIFEKSELIYSLQEQLDQNRLDPSIQLSLQGLKDKTILTEQDWDDFQSMFDKIDKGFFNRMKQISPGITVAELRFAAIIRLKMNNKQAGAMLGISTDSARKTRVRLRHRLNISGESNLEEVVLNI